MIIESSADTCKTDLLIKKYIELLHNGISSTKILVLVQNSTARNNFKKRVFEKLKISMVEELKIHSFLSLVYNTIFDNWAFLEDRNIFDNPVILPNMTGLEVSQYLLKDILKQVKFKGYNSRMSLLHQLFRRYSLIVQNNLSQKEVDERSEMLKEGFSDEASLAIKKLLRRTLELRDFDYLRQCMTFNFVYKNTEYFKNIEYLIIDDADELTPICMDFVEYLSKNLKDFWITIDPLGSSRCGYLSADKNNFVKFKKIFGQDIQKIESNSKISIDANNLFKNVQNNEENLLKSFFANSYSKRSVMLDEAIKQVKTLLETGNNPCDISIIAPEIDDMLKFALKENFGNNLNLVYLSGNEKLVQNKFVLATLTILKLNTDLRAYLTEFDLRIILSEFLRIPLKYCEDILDEFSVTKTLVKYNFKDEEYNYKFGQFVDLVEQLANSGKKLSEQIIDIYNFLFNFSSATKNEINKFNFFVKQIKDFEGVFGAEFNKHKTDIILQTENSIIAENPYSVLEIEQNDLIVSTFQKIIDNKVKTKYQIWLDITNSQWIKSDTGPLYNAWVFQKDWDKNEYTIEDNISLSKDKIARVLRKLTLCATDFIYCYSSLFDSNGVENFGAIEQYIICDNTEEEKGEEKKVFKITPRDDQKPVLEYKSGSMGISAVPGAGKTTILLALLIKLLDSGVNPENIFVLTYMDSAARNFRERIKNVNRNSSKLPNISTIHGLALRILKENGNYERIGLSADFEICDDAHRNRILREIAAKMRIDSKLTDEFDKAVSVFKFNKGSFPQLLTDEKLKKFKMFYNAYCQKLKNNNLIDYDDMLTNSVEILANNPDILKHYQNICHYIVEDEAQDSSKLQQQLINLLAGKHKNIIRCGDVNQSITGTFSNADVEGFRKFITENQNVSMNCSQRCARPVWELANKLVKSSENSADTNNAFYKMYMKPVEGKNPNSDIGVESIVFDTGEAERNFILKTIKTTLSKNPTATVGILLRYNYQVADWQNLIENSGFKVITRNQSLEQKAVFKVIFAILKIILRPFDNNTISDSYKILSEYGMYKIGLSAEIEKYENPFIQIDSDNLQNIYLERFYWDINYWLSLCYLPPYELAQKVAFDLKIFNSEIDKCNIQLISTLIKRICVKNNSLEYAINRLEELAKRPNLSGFKFFSEEDEEDKSFVEGKVQIMTMHKSKGDEFNLVFIPELSDKSFPLDIKSVTLKNSDFLEKVKSLNPNYSKKSDYELKKEILNENYRLLYVAITRAKNRLYFTSSQKSKNKFGKYSKNTPNIIFKTLLEGQYVE